jgi:selenocysteine lyase/cysteine desulfurase
MTMNWQTAYDAYPANERHIWMNNAGTTPPGRHIIERMASHFARLGTHGPEQMDPPFPHVSGRIKGHLGSLLGARSEDIALIHNTAEGMTMLSLGLSLEPGDEILLLENEYPSNVYPWEYWQTRGVTLNFVPQSRTPEEFLKHFRERLSPRTKAVALSMVHWCTGMPLPVEPIAELCHERDIFFALDGSQGVGQIPLNFGKCAPMALCFSAWKWLLGPLGLGVLVADKTTVAKLSSPFKGTDSVKNPASYLPYQAELKETAERYTYSTPNTNDWVYFDESLGFLASLGFDAICARIRELTSRLWRPLRDAGFNSGYDHGDHTASGILCVSKPGVDLGKLTDTLVENGVVARLRLGRIRLAPHVYLSEEQIDRVSQLLVEHSK